MFSRSLFLLRPSILLFSIAAAGLAQAASMSADEHVTAAREAYRAGDRARLARHAEAARGHALAPYLDYWQISLRLSEADADTLRAFLVRNERSYLAEKLRGEWLKQLGRKQEWAAFAGEYAKLAQPDTELVCFDLQGRLARGDQSALDEGRPLWLGQIDPPESCQAVADALAMAGRLAPADLWPRLRRAAEAKKLTSARQTAAYLPPGSISDPALVEAITRPSSFLAHHGKRDLEQEGARQAALLALARQARIDPAEAKDALQRIESALSAEERGYAWGQIGWQAAMKHLPQALEWYRQAGNTPFSEEQHAWHVRAALRARDWAAVRTAIERMPPAQAAQPDWVYWLGRAYKAHGKLAEANALFSRIAGQAHFYGNLADEELGRAIPVPPRSQPPGEAEVARAAAHPAIRRALALLRQGIRIDAIREWNWALQDMGDRELLATAEVARRNEIFDRAINTANRTQGEHDYQLRFLAPFREVVAPQAKRLDLDDAWVYGLMRQESRFVMDAKSPVGASGLMQLMPKTAAWVAKKLGLRNYDPKKVRELDTNVLLGTSYLKMVLESLDNHPVLASAAYNAGPGRARRWRDAQPLEGAVYAETIPFSETRDYVKKVMSNAVYYSALYNGRSDSLKSLLGVVGPRSNGGENSDLP